MSWGLRSRASIYLSRHHVRVRVWRVGLLRDVLIDEHVIQSNPAEQAIDDALRYISEVGGAGSRVTIFLGASESILDVVSAVPGLQSDADWRALARQRLLVDAGIAPDQWRTGYTLLSGARQAFVAAVPASLTAKCSEISASHGYRNTEMHIFSLRCLGYAALNQPQNLTFRLIEPGAVTQFDRSDAWSIIFTQCASHEPPESVRNPLTSDTEKIQQSRQLVAEFRYASSQSLAVETNVARQRDYFDLLAWAVQ